MKKLYYLLCAAAVLALFGILLYRRMNRTHPTEKPAGAQTIIPLAPQVVQQSRSTSEAEDEHAQSSISLLSDEVLIDDIPVDINGDGKEDKIIAAKKLSDQFIYLFLFLYDDKTKTLVRRTEIKTEATHAKTLSIHTVSVREYECPLIVYSGMNSDALQVFGMYTVKTDKEDAITVQPLISLQADGNIIAKTNDETTLKAYTIAAYYSDTDEPNTLNKIEKVYTWNEKKTLFEKRRETRIHGKKIESQFLKKFQTGSTHTFQEFLEGLWYQPSAKKNQNRSIFFNYPEKEIVFAAGTTQEVFTINATTPRRFGIDFSTKNASISSIHRRITVELRSVDEVYIQVIDDIAQLKIGVASNWDGVYRKIQNTVHTAPHAELCEQVREKLEANGKTWSSPEGDTLHFSDYSYRLVQDTVKKTGRYTLLQVSGNTVLQLKDADNTEHFFKLTFDSSGSRLTLLEVTVTLKGLTPLGNLPLQFE